MTSNYVGLFILGLLELAYMSRFHLLVFGGRNKSQGIFDHVSWPVPTCNFEQHLCQHVTAKRKRSSQRIKILSTNTS
jgi:hypothetical protein